MKKTLTILVVVLIVIAGWAFWYINNATPDNVALVVEEEATQDDQREAISDQSSDVNTENSDDDAIVYMIADESVVMREGSAVGKKHRWTVAVSEGSVRVLNDLIVDGSVEIAMDTIVIDDIADADSNAKLLGEFENEFFMVGEYPTATFEMTVFDEASQQMEGELTIKGVTNTIVVPVQTTVTDQEVRITADFSIERSLRGLDMWEGMVQPYIALSFDLNFIQ